MDLRKAYAFDYWLAPRLTFDAGTEITVAQPFNDRYPPYTLAVDQSPRPAYVVLGGVELFRTWLKVMRSGAREHAVGVFRVFYDFRPPPDARPLPRSGFTVRSSEGRGDPASLLDGQLDTGWSSGRGPDGSGWIEVDLGAERVVSGLTLVNDHVERLPGEVPAGPLAVMVGPKGGFTVKERDAALGAGWAPVRLARATLRFDTAGIVALALAAAARAGDRTEEGR